MTNNRQAAHAGRTNTKSAKEIAWDIIHETFSDTNSMEGNSLLCESTWTNHMEALHDDIAAAIKEAREQAVANAPERVVVMSELDLHRFLAPIIMDEMESIVDEYDGKETLYSFVTRHCKHYGWLGYKAALENQRTIKQSDVEKVERFLGLCRSSSEPDTESWATEALKIVESWRGAK